MTTGEYLQELEVLLRAGRMAPRDVEDAVFRCSQHIQDAGSAHETEVLADLGSPEELAREILEDYRQNLKSRGQGKGGSTVWKILIGIFLSPVIVSFYCGVAGLFIGGAFCVLLGVFYGIIGIGALLPGGLGTFLNFIGGGFLAAGAGLLLCMLGLVFGIFCNFCMKRLFGQRRTV